MKYILFVFLLLFVKSVTSQTQTDNISVIKAVIEYTKPWGYNLLPNYSNKFLLEDFETEKKIRDWDYLDSGASKYWEVHTNDTLLIEGYKFSYLITKKLAESTDKQKLPELKINYTIDSGSIRFSIPVYSIDNNISMVYIETFSKGLCGSGEVFILERKFNAWQIKNRIFKRVY
jgi:hypothetical protein